MSLQIAVVSAKGGVGGSLVCANLACALAKLGKRVLAVDLHFLCGSLDLYLSCSERGTFRLSDCLQGKCRASQLVVVHPKVPNLYLLPYDKTCSVTPDVQQVSAVLSSLFCQFDVILLACGNNSTAGFHCALALAHRVILVTTPQVSSLRSAARCVDGIKSYTTQKILLVVNQVRKGKAVQRELPSLAQVEQLLKEKIFYCIFDDELLYLGDCNDGEHTFKKMAKKLIAMEREGE